MNRKMRYKAGAWLLLCLLCCQCKSTVWNKPATPEDQARAICLGWNNLLLELERHTPGYRPPVSARMFAYVALGAYETALPALPNYRSLETDLPGFRKTALPTEGLPLNLPASLNACYAHIVARFFLMPKKPCWLKLIVWKKHIKMNFNYIIMNLLHIQKNMEKQWQNRSGNIR